MVAPYLLTRPKFSNPVTHLPQKGYSEAVPRIRVVALSIAFVIGSMLTNAPGAHAANVGSVTVSYEQSSMSYSFTPISLAGVSGDTFTLVNTMISVNSYIAIANATGSATSGASSCIDATSVCKVIDSSTPPSALVTIVSPGTFTIYRVYNNGVPFIIGTLTIGASDSSPTDPALVYPTLTLNANGGSCTGDMQFIKRNGENDTVALPTSTECSRTNYSFLGWARSESAKVADFTTVVPIGPESFDLYAVWKPNGIAVTYDANVGMDDPCLANGVNASNVANRSVTRVLNSSSTGEALTWESNGVARWSSTVPTPVCAPTGFVFDGWSTTGTGKARDGQQANEIITGFTNYPSGTIPTGSEVTLHARWSVTYGITVLVRESTIEKGATTTATFTATRNGSPVANAQVKVSTSGDVTLDNDATSSMLTTDITGSAKATVIAKSVAGSGIVTVAFGDKSASSSISVTDPVTKGLVITGERTTVSGKPGIRVSGIATGFAEGTTVKPWFRFPGETTFVEGTARPVIVNGEFEWQRKTGKKFYAYFTSEDGSVKSNRVIIPAN